MHFTQHFLLWHLLSLLYKSNNFYSNGFQILVPNQQYQH